MRVSNVDYCVRDFKCYILALYMYILLKISDHDEWLSNCFVKGCCSAPRVPSFLVSDYSVLSDNDAVWYLVNCHELYCQ